MWQQDLGVKMTGSEAQAKLRLVNQGQYNDWRIPTMKELFSLALFTGRSFGDKVIQPFIDTAYFRQPKGDTAAGEREIDAQTWSSDDYTGLTMANESSRFGMNFVDGRIKSYPLKNPRLGTPVKMYYRFVRGNPEYGKNRFHDNGDGTISDEATGLMWQKHDSGSTMDWSGALTYAAKLDLAGHTDWRLPSIKELQSIVDYSRSPKATNSAAIDPLFSCSAITNPDGKQNYPYYWSGTTLLDGPQPGNQPGLRLLWNRNGQSRGKNRGCPRCRSSAQRPQERQCRGVPARLRAPGRHANGLQPRSLRKDNAMKSPRMILNLTGFLFTTLLSPILSAQAADTGFSLRILGSGGPGYNPQRAEPSVLLRLGDDLILVDMGNRTQAGLAEAGVRRNELSALSSPIIISTMNRSSSRSLPGASWKKSAAGRWPLRQQGVGRFCRKLLPERHCLSTSQHRCCGSDPGTRSA